MPEGGKMASSRKDNKGRVLRQGECQRSQDNRYVYTYTDPYGRRKYIYAKDLMELRKKEDQLKKSQLDGLDVYVAGKATINEVYESFLIFHGHITCFKPTVRENLFGCFFIFIVTCHNSGAFKNKFTYICT